MKINEYKNEVASLSLSKEFKENLKAKMLEEYSEKTLQKPEIKMTPADFAKKYSKYIALAACLLLVVSTVGILSIGGIKTASPSTDSAYDGEAENAQLGTFALESERDTVTTAGTLPEQGAEDALNAPAPMSVDGEEIPEAVEDVEDVDAAEDVSEDASEDAPDAANYIDGEEALGSDQPVETIPASGNGYSYKYGSNYDGNYSSADYVLKLSGENADIYASEIKVNVEVNARVITKIEQEMPSGSGEQAPEAPAAVPETAPTENVEEAEAQTYDDAVSADGEIDIDRLFYEMQFSDSREYYDVRDGEIARLENVGLIRFDIEDSYCGETVIALNSNGGSIDPQTQTLYKVLVTYDYFNREQIASEEFLINDGTAEVQLLGRPIMEGEYIAVVSMDAYGNLIPVKDLIYAVYNVNGVDLAYHVYSPDGFMVDPGDTHMGLQPEERAVIKSTSNNPEIYTQKAAVSELTYYLRRNILRMEPKLTDLSTEKSQPASSEAEPESEEARDTLRANYPSGTLVVTNNDPDADGLITVNGISVGDYLSDAVKALYLTDYMLSPDCVLTLVASEEDGGFRVTVRFENGIVAEIKTE